MVTFDRIYEALTIAPQFVHWSNDHIKEHLEDLYKGYDYEYPDYDWMHKHEGLVDAYNMGFAKDMLFYPRETIAALAKPEGSVCVLCYSWSETAQVASLRDGTAMFENMLCLGDEDGEAYAVCPDIYCSKCRFVASRNPHYLYSQGYTKEQAYDKHLAELLQRKEFIKRAEKNYKNYGSRHKFEIKRASSLQTSQ